MGLEVGGERCLFSQGSTDSLLRVSQTLMRLMQTRVLHRVCRVRNKLNTCSFGRYTTDGKGEAYEEIPRWKLSNPHCFGDVSRSGIFDSEMCIARDRYFFLNIPAEIPHYSRLEIARETWKLLRDFGENLRHYIDHCTSIGIHFQMKFYSLRGFYVIFRENNG